jgi:biotin synthase
MGNFLTTLGNAPEQDRAMFEELGLNVARHADNGRNPRPDNRSGWLEGETPDVVSQALARPPRGDLGVRLWDPSKQLHYARKRARVQKP